MGVQLMTFYEAKAEVALCRDSGKRLGSIAGHIKHQTVTYETTVCLLTVSIDLNKLSLKV